MQSGEVSQVQVPIQERVIRVGNFLVINGYRANRTPLKQRFTDGGYQIHETPLFCSSCVRKLQVLLLCIGSHRRDACGPQALPGTRTQAVWGYYTGAAFWRASE